MEQAQSHITDVVEQFSYTATNQTYNRAFHDWRKHAKTPFAYRYTHNTRESVFVDGAGFLHTTAAETAHNTLARSGKMLGLALLAFLVCEVGGETAITNLLHSFFGIDIQLSLLSMDMYGNQWAIVWVKIFVCLAQYLLAGLILFRSLRLPRAVYAPMRAGCVWEYLGGASVGIFSGLLISNLTSSVESSYFSISQQLIYSYKDTNAVLVYALFDLFFVSLLSELFYRGLMLQMLRQYGDLFAIVTVAMIAALMPNDISYRLGELLIGILSGYFMLHSGSLLCCYLIRVAYAICLLAHLLIDNSIVFPGITYPQLSVLVGFAAVCGLCCYLLACRRKQHSLALKNRCAELSSEAKCNALLGTITMLPWLCVALILSMVQLLTI